MQTGQRGFAWRVPSLIGSALICVGAVAPVSDAAAAVTASIQVAYQGTAQASGQSFPAGASGTATFSYKGIGTFATAGSRGEPPADELDVYVDNGGGCAWVPTTGPTTSGSCGDTALVLAVGNHTLLAVAYDANGTSAQSPVFSLTVQPSVPGAPTIGTATPGNAQASVTFTAPSTNGGSAITSYTATSSPGGLTASGSGSPLVVTGLTNGTTYTFTVTATNAAGAGPASAPSNSVVPMATVPGPPTSVSATAANSLATVTFSPPSSGGTAIISYTATSNPGGLTTTGPHSPLVVTGLTNGTAYTLTVAATNGAGTGPASAPSNSVTPANVPAATLQPVTSVGRTSGNFAVSAAGAAAYTIPLWTPPGARGVEPHLQLRYDSRGSDGLLGPGWSLDGFSYVTRCNRTYAQDGAPAAVTLTASDALCLNGNRLFLGSGTYGADQSTYGTEIADFSQILLHNPGGNMTASWFEVHRKDGLIYEYGNTTDSRVLATGTSTPLMWALNKIRDRQGNNLIVGYSTTPGAVVPATVQYTQTPATSTAYNYTITFTWGARSPGDDIIGFVAGTQVVQTNLLTNVNVAYQGAAVHNYALVYSAAPTTARARLASVQECAGPANSDCLAPTQIVYQDGAPGVASLTTSVGGGANASGSNLAYFIDLNGDGRADVLNGIASGSTYHWYAQFATATGFGPQIDTGVVTNTTDPILFDDFLTEGKNGILALNAGVFWYYRWNGTAFVGSSTGLADSNRAPRFHSMICVDVDGDGRPDIVWIGADGHLYMRQNQGGTTAPNFGTSVFDIGAGSAGWDPGGSAILYGNNSIPWSSVKHMDFDGDGREDFLVWNNAGHAQLFEILSRGTSPVAIPSNGAFLNINSQNIAPVNWNDDACTDLYAQGQVLVSDCNGATGGTIVIGGGQPGYPPAAMDWDGDGRTDLLIVNTANGQLYLYRSTGDGVAAGVSVMTIPGYASYPPFYVFDQNGDGLDDLAFADPTASWVLNYGMHNGPGTAPDLATSFTDGFAASYTPAYTSILQGNYTAASAAYPEKEYAASIFVVSSFAASDGIGGSYTQSFSYKDSRLNVQGRGFEGFGARTMTDTRDGLIRSDAFAQAFPYTGIATTSGLLQADGVTPISVTARTPASLSASTAAGTVFPYVQQASTTEYEVSTGALYGKPVRQTSISTTLDGFGNPTSISTSVTDEDTTSPNNGKTWTRTRSKTVTPDTTNWCLASPTQILETRSEPGGASTTRTTDLTWDYLNCRVTQKVEEPSSATLQTTTNYGYDSCGNRNSIQVLGENPDGTSMPARTTTYNYAVSSSNCQAPESVQNALGQTTTVSYRYDLGQIQSVTDPNGIVAANWSYDNFSRPTLMQRPDGTQTSWAYTACVAPSYCWHDSTSLYSVRQIELDATSGHAAYWFGDKVFDQFDRLRYDEPEQSNGMQTQTAFGYDALGRLTSQSNPYGNGFSTYYTTTTFDSLNRPLSVCRPVNSTNATTQCTNFAYAGQTRTVTDPRGNVKTKLFDVLGELIQLTDPDGVSKALYTYDPFQNLTVIQDPGGNQTVRTFDIRGHLLTWTDPDRGGWTFESDSLGERVHVRDAKTAAPAWTQVLSYDVLGRIASRAEAEGTTTWMWGTSASAHEIGQLNQISGLGETETYTYDAFGRLSDRTTTWAGSTYAFDYVYNTLGRLDTLVYPATPVSANRFQVKYGYANGVLWSLQNYTGDVAGTTFWELTPGGVNMDPWGHVVDETLGSTPGARIVSYYDAVTSWPSTREVGTGGTANNVQSLAYQWDQNGNLSQRQDLLQGLGEAFTYDNLDRVSSSTLNGVQNLSVVIDPSGNITSRTEGGSSYAYGYDPVHRHAVSTMGTAAFTYDANGNLATRNGYTLGWTSYNLPSSIQQSSGSSTFLYGPKRDRIQEVSTYTAEGDSGTETTISIGGAFDVFTEPAQTHYKHYIQAPGGTQIIYDLQSVSGAQTSYVAGDHLGSSSVLLNSAYAAPLQMSFSAYGYRRASTWSGPLSPTAPDYAEMAKTTRHGYLSQQMLDNLSLVHLNGRVYDPVIERFLSPDPILSQPYDSQELNPYSYVANRPLSRSDPTGLDDGPAPPIPEPENQNNPDIPPPDPNPSGNSPDVPCAAWDCTTTDKRPPKPGFAAVEPGFIPPKPDPGGGSGAGAPQRKLSTCTRVANGISGAVAGAAGGATFAALTGNLEAIPAAAGVGAIAGGLAGAVSPDGGPLGALAAGLGSIVGRAGSGYSTSGLAGVGVDAGNGGVAPGALSIPVGAALGAAQGVVDAAAAFGAGASEIGYFGSGALGGTAIGANAGGAAALVTLTVNSVLAPFLSNAFGCSQ